MDNGGVDWLTPVATLLAVLIGSWTSWLAQSKLANRRAVTEAQAAREQRQAEARAAAAQREAERLAAAEQRAAEREAIAEQRAAEETVAMRLREADERAAARLIQGDVSLAADHVRNILQDGYWLAFYRCDVPHWGDAETLLARALSAEDWEVVSQSALELNRYEETMRQTVGPDGPHPGARQVQFDSPSAQRGLRAIWENATEAYNVLAPLAHNEPVEGLLHEGAP